MQNFNFGAIFDPFGFILRKSGIMPFEREFHQLSFAKKPHQKILRRSKVIKKAVRSIFLQNDPHAGCVHAVHAGHAEYLFQPGDSQNVYVTCAENRISKY